MSVVDRHILRQISKPLITAIIIGSGMYGAFCAERIYRRGGRVLVLEAGPFVVSEHVQNMADPFFDAVEAEDLLGLSTFGEFRSPVFKDENGAERSPAPCVGSSDAGR